MKKTTIFLLLLTFSTTLFAQLSDNEWEVNQTPQGGCQYVDGEVIVKFKDNSGVSVQRVKGKFMSAGAHRVDAVLKDSLGVFEVDDLMPLSGHTVSQNVPRRVNGTVVYDQNLSRLCLLHFDTTQVQSVDEAIAILEQNDIVEYAEPNYIVHIWGAEDNIKAQESTTSEIYNQPVKSPRYIESSAVGNSAIYSQEPLYSQQWGLTAINLPWLWNQPIVNTRRPVIAIIDTGVDVDHPDLADNIWQNDAEVNGLSGQDDDNNGYFDDIHGYDFVYNTGVISDRNGHGTHCAGIAAAVGDNGIGITGANPNALVMPITVMRKDGTGTTGDIVRGIDYAVANGADVLSLSLGMYCYSFSLEDACQKAFSNNKVIISAAGNDGSDIYAPDASCVRKHSFPAAFKYVLAVEASDLSGLASFSNYDSDGPIFSEYGASEGAEGIWNGDMYNYELRAPGVNVMSTFPNGKYKSMSGTSMACPMVAGAISRLLQCRDYVNQESLAGCLIQTRDSTIQNIDLKAAFEMDEDAITPVLVMAGYEIVDTINGGNGDGKINPGETLEIYPFVRCVCGHVDNLHINLEQGLNVDTTIVKVIKGDAALGYSLTAGAFVKSQEPLIVKVNSQCGNGYESQLYPKFRDGDNETISLSDEYIRRLILRVEDKFVITGVFNGDTIFPQNEYYLGKIYIADNTTMRFEGKSILHFLYSEVSKANGKIFNIVGDETNRLSIVSEVTSIDMDTISYADITGRFFANVVAKKCYIHGSYNAWNARDVLSLCFSNMDFDGEWDQSSVRDFSITSSNVFLNDCPIRWDCQEGNGISIIPSFSWTSMGYTTELPIYSYYSSSPQTISLAPNYYGSNNVTNLKKYIWDSNYDGEWYESGWGIIDYSTRLSQPSSTCPGMVWKIMVDDVDSQDEFDQMSPLGVGRHKFDVFYNRPMDIDNIPTISFGVRPPCTQNVVVEDGQWSSDSTIYTAYITLTGKITSDGINYIKVVSGLDNEGIQCPEALGPYKMIVQVVGSLSTGLMATPGLGKVTLDWLTDEEDFADLLGYNIYRWTEKNDSLYTDYDSDGNWVGGHYEYFIRRDTTIINTSLLESEVQQFVDFDVVPGTTYYYTIKQVTTSLQSYELSNVVAATPQTAIKGDANGSMSVDVADVITEVNYIGHQNPQPFIFEAADVNSDNTINVLDIVGTINLIMHPGAQSQSINNGTATYYIENGILYINSDVVLGGVQFTLAADSATATITPLDVLAPFEKVNQWNNAEEYFFMAYSMSGKTIGIGETALMQIGDADITSITLSDPQGHNVAAAPRISTHLDGTKFLPNTEKYINNGSFYVRIGERIYNATGVLVK